jgi:hypothetical protein
LSARFSISYLPDALIQTPLPVVSPLLFSPKSLVVFILGSVFSLGYIHNPTCTTTNDPYVSLPLPRLYLLAPSCVRGCIAIECLVFSDQINEVKKSCLLLLISTSTLVRARFLVRPRPINEMPGYRLHSSIHHLKPSNRSEIEAETCESYRYIIYSKNNRAKSST